MIAGDEYSVKELLYGLMLPSGNDAALALAKWGGTYLVSKKGYEPFKDEPAKAFISYMNKCAKDLNMMNSKFGNPHGLPHSGSGSTPE